MFDFFQILTTICQILMLSESAIKQAIEELNIFVRFGWSSYVRAFTVIHYSTNRSISHTY